MVQLNLEIVLLLPAADRNASNDELAEEEVDDDDGENREGNHHVDLPHVELQEVGAAELSNQNRQRLFVRGVQNQGGGEVVVPRADEGENRLNRQSGLNHWQNDAVERAELAAAVDARGFDDLQRQARLHVLVHEVEHRGAGNGRQEQRQEGILQVHLAHQLHEAQRGNLRRHRHNQQDEGKGKRAPLEAVRVNAERRQRGEVARKNRRHGGNDERIAHTGDNRDVRVVYHLREVVAQRRPRTRQEREALLDIRVRAGCVDDEDVEEEQAQRAEQNQHRIRHDAPRGQHRMGAGLLVFCLGLHFHRCLTHAALPPFTAFAAFAGLGLRSSSPRVVRMITTHSTAQITNMMADTAPARP